MPRRPLRACSRGAGRENKQNSHQVKLLLHQARRLNQVPRPKHQSLPLHRQELPSFRQLVRAYLLTRRSSQKLNLDRICIVQLLTLHPATATGPSLDPAVAATDKPTPVDQLPSKDSTLKEGDTNKALPREPTPAEPGNAAAVPPATTTAAGMTTKTAEGSLTTAEDSSKAGQGASTEATSAPKVAEPTLPPNTHIEKPLPYNNASSATGMSATSGPLDDHPAQFATESSGAHLDREESGDATPFATPMEAPLSGDFEKPSEIMDATVKGGAGAQKPLPQAST